MYDYQSSIVFIDATRSIANYNSFNNVLIIASFPKNVQVFPRWGEGGGATMDFLSTSFPGIVYQRRSTKSTQHLSLD